MITSRTRLLTAVTAVALTAATACSSSSSSSGSGSSKSPSSSSGAGASSSGTALSGTITVFAAASLTEVFTTLGKQFEAAHPGVTVKFNFGASSALAAQIGQGAPADVFASASPKNMEAVISSGGAKTSTNFVKNTMEIAVPPSNPAKITALADLARSGVKVALCQSQVPCGKTAQQVFTNAKITVKAVTLEQDVKATLTKVELGEVDAGVVYVTDVKAAGSKVTGIEIPKDVNASTAYPIAVLNKAPNSAGAEAFVQYVLGPDGQSALSAAGFLAP